MIRKMTKDDDIDKVASLIYKTEPEFFSFLLGKPEKGIPKIKKLVLSENNAFSYKYTYCSFDKEIRGILIGYGYNEIDKKKQGKDYKEIMSLIELLFLPFKALLVSYVLTEPRPQEIYIQNICVEPDYRGKGIGGELLKYIIEHAKSQNMSGLSLDVTISNTRAKNLYERIGFKAVRKKFYPFSSEGAYRMELNLKEK